MNQQPKGARNALQRSAAEMYTSIPHVSVPRLPHLLKNRRRPPIPNFSPHPYSLVIDYMSNFCLTSRHTQIGCGILTILRISSFSYVLFFVVLQSTEHFEHFEQFNRTASCSTLTLNQERRG
jgi:hypothetical protein